MDQRYLTGHITLRPLPLARAAYAAAAAAANLHACRPLYKIV